MWSNKGTENNTRPRLRCVLSRMPCLVELVPPRAVPGQNRLVVVRDGLGVQYPLRPVSARTDSNVSLSLDAFKVINRRCLFCEVALCSNCVAFNSLYYCLRGGSTIQTTLSNGRGVRWRHYAGSFASKCFILLYFQRGEDRFRVKTKQNIKRMVG